MTSTLQAHMDEHQAVLDGTRALEPQLRELADACHHALKQGGKLLWMGNGGSAADAQHLAAEFLGRFEKERHALPSLALTTNTSTLTAIGNDYGYDRVFSRQLEALAQPHDVVIGISTSGNSANVCQGIEVAKARGAFTAGMTGGAGGQLADLVDCALVVPSLRTARIQEMHILLGHVLCAMLEAETL